MGITTAIEYCDSTVNPVMGCSGCELWSRDPAQNHCYAAALCDRRRGKGWPADFHRPEHFPGRLEQAIRWPDLTGTDRPGKPWLNGLPRIIFVNDLSDGFCPTAPDPWAWLDPYLVAMAGSPHIYLLLTKWPERMAEFLRDWPVIRNIWLGTTVTSSDTVRRVRALADLLPGWVRWLSLEPLLSAVDLTRDGLLSHFSWVAAGGESGRNARPCAPLWGRQLRDQCLRAGVAFFWKQNGEWAAAETALEVPTYAEWSGNRACQAVGSPLVMWRIGKKRAGRLLQGEEWSQMPTFLKGE